MIIRGTLHASAMTPRQLEILRAIFRTTVAADRDLATTISKALKTMAARAGFSAFVVAQRRLATRSSLLAQRLPAWPRSHLPAIGLSAAAPRLMSYAIYHASCPAAKK